MDLEQFREMYFADVTERLIRMNQLVLALEADPQNHETIDALFRETHSLKGMAASMHYQESEKLSHHLESLLDPCRKSGEIPPDEINLLLKGIDLLEELLDDIGKERPERCIDLTVLSRPFPGAVATSSLQRGKIAGVDLPPLPAPALRTERPIPVLPASAISGNHSKMEKTVRIRTELLDQLMNLTGELVTNRFMLQAAGKDRRWSDLDRGLENMGKMVGDLHHHVLQARMTPMKRITARLPRLVHDLAQKTGKEIRLLISGEELELDRSILDLLADPLIHLVRNAVDHGIAEKGEITLRAWSEKNMACLEVTDNGKGMEPEALRQQAVTRGLMSREAVDLLETNELLQLICTPGFSTTTTIGEISGRGVGMNIVKKAVENLSGTLEIRSLPGAGSSFLLKLPLTIFIIRILLIRCAGRIIGLPITRILNVQEFSVPGDDSSPGQSDLFHHRTIHHLVSLAALLDLEGKEDANWVAFTEANGRVVGLVFGELLGQREAYVKPLSSPLDQFDVLSGTTTLGDGQVVFIIDPLVLLQKGRHDRPTIFDPAGTTLNCPDFMP